MFRVLRSIRVTWAFSCQIWRVWKNLDILESKERFFINCSLCPTSLSVEHRTCEGIRMSTVLMGGAPSNQEEK